EPVRRHGKFGRDAPENSAAFIEPELLAPGTIVVDADLRGVARHARPAFARPLLKDRGETLADLAFDAAADVLHRLAPPTEKHAGKKECDEARPRAGGIDPAVGLRKQEEAGADDAGKDRSDDAGAEAAVASGGGDGDGVEEERTLGAEPMIER